MLTFGENLIMHQAYLILQNVIVIFFPAEKRLSRDVIVSASSKIRYAILKP